jgi:hypothetical protein
LFYLRPKANNIYSLYLSQNENIFELDLLYFKKNMDLIREELMMKVFHPLRLEKYLNIGYNICSDEYM